MYKNYDNANQPAKSIHAAKHVSEKEHNQAAKEQEDQSHNEVQDKSEGSHTIVVPFSTTQTGSFQ
ncbi:hypothetical protein D3C72_191000 [compost metagenome]